MLRDDFFYAFNFSPQAYMDVRRQKKPEITKIDFDLQGFDYIIICSPIWIGNIPPQVKTFFDEILKKTSQDQKFIIIVSSGKCKKEFEDVFANRLKNQGFNNVKVIGIREKFFEKVHKEQLLSYIDNF